MDFAGDDERIPDDIGATGGGRLLRAFGGIDGKYVAEAAAGEDESEEDRAGRADFTRRFNRWGSLVAALAVTLAAVVIYQGISRGVRTESDGEQPALGTAAENTAAAGETAVGESTDEEASGAQSDGVWLSAGKHRPGRYGVKGESLDRVYESRGCGEVCRCHHCDSG